MKFLVTYTSGDHKSKIINLNSIEDLTNLIEKEQASVMVIKWKEPFLRSERKEVNGWEIEVLDHYREEERK